VTTLLDRARAVRDGCEALLHATNAERDRVTLAEANEVARVAREAEGWLKGVRERLA